MAGVMQRRRLGASTLRFLAGFTVGVWVVPFYRGAFPGQIGTEFALIKACVNGLAGSASAGALLLGWLLCGTALFGLGCIATSCGNNAFATSPAANRALGWLCSAPRRKTGGSTRVWLTKALAEVQAGGGRGSRARRGRCYSTTTGGWQTPRRASSAASPK